MLDGFDTREYTEEEVNSLDPDSFPYSLDGARCFVFVNGIILWATDREYWLVNYLDPKKEEFLGGTPISIIGEHGLGSALDLAKYYIRGNEVECLSSLEER